MFFVVLIGVLFNFNKEVIMTIFFQLGGILTETIKNELDGTFSIESLKALYEQNSHHSSSTLVCIENTHCRMGGRVLPLRWLGDVRNI